MGEVGTIKLSEYVKPNVSEYKVVNLIQTLYGLQTQKVKELNGFDDQNFWFKPVSVEGNPYLASLWEHGYVLKIANSKDSQDSALFDAQKELMFHFHRDGFEVSLPILNKRGQYNSLEELKFLSTDDDLEEKPMGRNMIRVLRFIPGKTLYEIDPWTVDNFFQCGQYVGRMDQSLKSFHHSAYDTRYLSWSLTNVPKLSSVLHVVEDPDRVTLMTDIIETFKREVLPRLPELEEGIIHGDVNDHNIVVKQRSDNPLQYDIVSVIDFGDSQKNPLLFELAITIMYMMLKHSAVHPNQTGGHVIAGYIKHRKIPRLEMDLLRTCIASRFAQALILGAYSYRQNPTNEYLLLSAKTGWKVVEEFWCFPKEQLMKDWQQIVSEYQN
ncbi:hypothetical protein TCAL_02332 [Tigriopus californicus]|uniref:Hydroxylysine kinase n=1 Tax=Tigriopus californicus TaxID=6832 RepID=A0A553NX19_TIGCA|nr:hydroxylysine kinase-like [Tigriopus californicus]TRY69968.1 hypothetical protein TCAL_02332 [Tigriopus californicus]|eukprot:TCALIF_02332-PA protein Name:"Similar to hykk Hydroxylysine kinase (Xenopus laevis)" AED:0.01 eAED:0.01 QI:0/-1/0/1/-1/1/1/0/381